MSHTPPGGPPPAPPAAAAAPPTRGIRGETRYDRVTGLLMAVVLSALLLFGWLMLVYASSEAYASRVAAPLEIVDVVGTGGGSPEGEIGSTETIDIPGAPPGEQASNNEADASEFEPPSLMATPAVMLDAAAEAGTLVADLGPAVSSGGPVASGRRASRIGTGGPGYGFGPGDGSRPREERWTVLFAPGQTAEEYARQLDFFGIELATINGPDSLIYASALSSPQPRVRVGPGASDRRLFFAWQGQGRKVSDVELLRKAGIEVGDKPILQFVPQPIEETLARLELTYRGRKSAEIRVTRFKVVPQGAGYAFEVIDQQTVR